MFEKLGKFEIKRVLGNGAMGEVYLGVDPSIGREVAIKTILPAAAQGGDAKERFAREAQAAGVLNHPNLVTIYEFGEDQGVLYIAMEFVRGHDLEELLQDQSLSRTESLEVLAQVCDGLNFAHRQQIVHRDIKPTNVRVQRDGKRLHAKVMDFGVAKISNSDMTATGMVMGTVSYMAPEYIRFGKPDPRSDLFAVGVMLYESLSGRKPFAGDTTPTVLYKIVNEAPDPIETEKLKGISPSIRTVLDRALCKNPDERYQTAEDLAKALRAAKDPSWMGQVEQATTLMQSSAPTASVSPAISATSAPTVQPMVVPAGVVPPAIPAARPGPPAKRSGTGLWIGLAALALIGIGGTGWWVWKARTQPGSETPPAEVKTEPLQVAKGNKPGKGPAAAAQGAATPRVPESTTAQKPSSQVQSETQPAGRVESRETRPAPTYPPQPRQPEPKAMDKPENYTPEKLETLEVHERKNLGNVTMSEAIQLSESQPEKAIQGFRQAIKADPYNASARAWLAWVFFSQGRTAEFVQEVREGRRLGLLGQMNQNVRFRGALNRARLNQQLPPELAY